MKHIINLNAQVEVVLTETGVKRLKAYAEALALPPGYDLFANKKVGDTYRSSLWELCSIFGPVLYNGCDIPFVSNCLVIEDD